MRPGSFSCLAIVAGLFAVSVSAQPLWWARRGVVVGPADDFVAANLGQLKTLSVAAALEMDLRLPGGADSQINTLVGPWLQPAGLGVSRDDYAALTVGQLKYVAKRFYDRLGRSYPWSATGLPAPDDYALANLGQLKYVFNFDILTPGVTDTDADGLDDTWENTRFGNLLNTGGGDPDLDGLDNRAEQLVGTLPSGTGAAATAVSTASLGLTIYSP